MKQSIYITILSLGTLMLGSCSKFLEEQSQSEVIPTTAADFRELLLGSGYLVKEEPFAFTFLMDDDVEFRYDDQGNTNPGSSTAIQHFPNFTWQPNFMDVNGLGQLVSENPGTTAYAISYKYIMGCNAVLDNIDEAIGTQTEKDRVRGEALAMRAWHYFRLVNVFGEPYNYNKDALGVPLKLTSELTDQLSARATVGQVYEVIVRDLQEAARLLDPLSITRRDYRINQPAIHILLSRVYLYMENWQGAVTEVNKAFEQGAQLVDLKTLYTSISYAYLRYANPEVEWVFGDDAELVQNPYPPNRDFIASFDAKDVRFRFGFSFSSGYYLISKVQASDATELRQSIRTPEAVLNRAEANAFLDNLSDALQDLNNLRRSRIADYQDVSITDKQELIQAIRNERRKELCFENHRWFDLRRYGMPAIEHRYMANPGEALQTFTLEEKDPMYTVPFPSSVITRNPGLQQNPGFSMPTRQGH
ncbi:MAG: RagB/SusD family nutrient uptake outer membrane protein [Candidatus Pseudobacter hemicellulosilyticus]|uniref:RagB/SusD family nutrient uptake outer membrane protein n=1 Tax=Candidatus Pseudobacter hemicellulosilyticus TaxID=3121375 RepID=A0AAJ6BH94_9BACT|nr:MAG: RagB/SusD family nutrient uptake outer membrane protein [Pseudobacter sp.]